MRCAVRACVLACAFSPLNRIPSKVVSNRSVPLEIPGGWVRGRRLELSRVHDPGSGPISGRGTLVGRDVRLFLPISQPGSSIGCIVIVCSSTSPSSTDDKVFVLRSRAYWHGGRKRRTISNFVGFGFGRRINITSQNCLRAYIKHFTTLGLYEYMHLFANPRGRRLPGASLCLYEYPSSQPTAAIFLASIYLVLVSRVCLEL